MRPGLPNGSRSEVATGGDGERQLPDEYPVFLAIPRYRRNPARLSGHVTNTRSQAAAHSRSLLIHGLDCTKMYIAYS